MFAQKVAKAQTKTAASSVNRLARQRSMLLAHRPGHGSVEEAPELQRAIGDQATLRLVAQPSRSVTGNARGDEYEREVDQAVRQAPGASWDFSKIPLFPPDRPNRPQAPSPFAAPPLPGAIQAKLVVGRVDGPLEHEADRVADQVMRMPDPELSIGAAPLQINRKRAACEEEEAKTLQTRTAGTSEAVGVEVPGIVHEVLRSPGQPLDAPARAFFEPRFGHSFEHVRVHADADAAASARVMNALAYTIGRDIVFAASRYQPKTNEGRRLLAHELAHVAQQQRHVIGEASSARTASPGDGAEHEARISADAAVSSNVLETLTDRPLAIARQEQDAGPVDASLSGGVATPPTAGTASSADSDSSGATPSSVTGPAIYPGVPRPLPFVEMKRNGIKFSLRLGTDYGHWWTEMDGSESYGWWPDHCPVTITETLFGTGGDLNGVKGCGGKPTQDPHHGDVPTDADFNPVLTTPKTDADVRRDIHSFVTSYSGSWRWPFGQNCRSFQRSLMSTVGLVEP